MQQEGAAVVSSRASSSSKQSNAAELQRQQRQEFDEGEAAARVRAPQVVRAAVRPYGELTLAQMRWRCRESAWCYVATTAMGEAVAGARFGSNRRFARQEAKATAWAASRGCPKHVDVLFWPWIRTTATGRAPRRRKATEMAALLLAGESKGDG